MGHRFHRRTQFNRLVILSSCRKFSHRGHRDNHCLSCNPVEDLATACPGRSRTGKSTNCHKEIVNHKLVLSAVEWIINRNGPSHEFHHFLNCTFAANDHFAGAGKVIIGSIARLFTEGNRGRHTRSCTPYPIHNLSPRLLAARHEVASSLSSVLALRKACRPMFARRGCGQPAFC